MLVRVQHSNIHVIQVIQFLESGVEQDLAIFVHGGMFKYCSGWPWVA